MTSARTSRQSFLGPKSDELISSSTVAIIGLCGGGSHVAQQLAHIGFRNMILVDPDTADESNLNRMVGLTKDDVAQKSLKTDVIARLVKAINPDSNLNLCPDGWQSHIEKLKHCDVIFGCVDSYGQREQLERFARRYLIPYIDVGMDVYALASGIFSISGQVILSLPDEPCMRCMGFLSEARLSEEANAYGAAGGKPQVVWPNGTLASVAVGKWMGLLTPWSPNLQPALYTEFDGNRNTVIESARGQAVRSTKCSHHGRPGSIGDPNL